MITKFLKFVSTIVAVSFLSLSFSASGAVAQGDEKQGGIELTDAWARARTATAKVGGAYVTVHNRGRENDRLIGVKSEIAHKAEIHTAKMTAGVMRMLPVRGGVEVKAGERVMLKPGSYHIMLMGLKERIEVGDTFSLILVFEKAGEIETTVSVEDAGAMGKMDHSKMNKAN